MVDFVQSLAIETWTLWTVGVLLIACRMVSRKMKFRSWANLQIEDWLMVIVAGTFTTAMFGLNEVAKNGSNFVEDDVIAAMTPKEREMAIYGSKMALLMELCTLSTIWLVKICLLILYHQLTVAYNRQHLIVKIIGVYCLIAYTLVVVMLLTFWCAPVQEYWALPPQNSECATYYKHMIFATVFNISSDIMLLCIPIPIVIQSRIPMKRKLVLCFVLGLGCLNILMAILNRYFNFSNPNDLIYTYWYVAELATAVYVGNLPLCWQFIAHVFKMGTWASFGSENRAQPPPNNDPGILPARKPKKKKFVQSMLPASLWSMGTQAANGEVTVVADDAAARRMGKSASEEAIMSGEFAPIDERQDIELSAGLSTHKKNTSWTTMEGATVVSERGGVPGI